MNYFVIKNFNIYEALDDFQSMLIVIENKQILYSLLLDMNSEGVYKNYISILDDNDKEVSLKDQIQYVPSIINMSINNKKNNNALLRIIKKSNSELLNKCSKEIVELLEEIFKKIKLELNLELISDIDFDVDDLLKFIDVMIKDDSDNPLERINLFIKTAFELFNVKIFIFYNLFSVLTSDQLNSLILECTYSNIKVINIENQDDLSYTFDKKTIVDNDICIIKN